MSKWKTINHKVSVDVMPIDDTQEHSYGDECWCSPTVERTSGSALVTHNEENHSFGDWNDDAPIVIGNKTRILSVRFCEDCGKVQARIGSVALPQKGA